VRKSYKNINQITMTPGKDQAPQGSRLLGRVLPMAVKLWLQSQVEQVEGLSFELQGTDKQILSGYVPGVAVAAQRAVYKGIHMGQLALAAQEVRINLGQVLRGKPLRLLQPFPVAGSLYLTQADLNASLGASLLAVGIRDFWQTLLKRPEVAAEVKALYQGLADLTPDLTLVGQLPSQARLEAQRLCLSTPIAPEMKGWITLRSQLHLTSQRHLTLKHTEWLADPSAAAGTPSQALEGFQWDLGAQANIQALTLEAEQLFCQGQVMVQP
jgi:LmeA-like phospholipid-binding